MASSTQLWAAGMRDCATSSGASRARGHAAHLQLRPGAPVQRRRKRGGLCGTKTRLIANKLVATAAAAPAAVRRAAAAANSEAAQARRVRRKRGERRREVRARRGLAVQLQLAVL